LGFVEAPGCSSPVEPVGIAPLALGSEPGDKND